MTVTAIATNFRKYRHYMRSLVLDLCIEEQTLQVRLGLVWLDLAWFGFDSGFVLERLGTLLDHWSCLIGSMVKRVNLHLDTGTYLLFC